MNRDLAILFFVVMAAALPFLGQPFHMDDNFYMDMARNAHLKPFYPNDTPYVFEGRFLPDMGSHSHPPLQTYFLSVLQRWLGEGEGKEWRYHSAALIFPLLAVSAFYFISARFVERPLWPALMLACCPLFMVMQHGLMTDIPTLAFWLAAVSAFLWAVDSGKAGLFLLSGLFQFAAMFTSYQSFALIPLLAFYQIRRRGGRAGWHALAAPPLAMIAWFLCNYFHYHRMILGDTLGYMGSRHASTVAGIATKLVAALEYQGWLIVFPFFLLYLLARGLRGRLFAVAVAAAVLLVQVLAPHYRLTDKFIFVVGLTAGVFVAASMFSTLLSALSMKEESCRPDPVGLQFLGLWYLGVLAYSVLILTEGSGRYLLPLVPPVLICFCRRLENQEVIEYRAVSGPLLNSAMLASGAAVISLAWGLLLSHADLEFARIYPRAAREFSGICAGMESYFGGEWGFRYYFRAAGVRQLPADESKVAGGGWIVLPHLALPYELPDPLKSMTVPVQTLTYYPATPLRLLDTRTPAGFYSTGWGMIPFSLSRNPLEEVEIRQVNFMVEGLPTARNEGSSSPPPWPGYLEIQGRSPLAVLAKSGTRIQYPWSPREPLSLELKFGVAPPSYTDGKSRRFTIFIEQRDGQGGALAGHLSELDPGLKKEDRKWQSVKILLQPGPPGSVLVFGFDCAGAEASGTAAFAESILRRP